MADSSSKDAPFPCSLTIRIPFPTPRLARTALRALAVDQELSPLVRREFSLATPTSASVLQPTAESSINTSKNNEGEGGRGDEATVLVTRYSATTNRMLRVAVNGFCESVGVVLACMRELDVHAVAEPWVGDGTDGADVGVDGGGAGVGFSFGSGREIDALERVQGLEEGGTIG